MIRVGNFALTEIAPGVWHGEEYRCDSIYIVVGEKEAALIDTGSGTCPLHDVVRAVTDLPYKVLLTHGHRDHSGGCRQFEEVYLHENDRAFAETVTLDLRQNYVQTIVKDEAFTKRIFSLMPPDGSLPRWLDYPDSIDLGGRALDVLPIPGHSAGSVCFLDKTSHILFLGDTLTTGTLILAPGEDRKEVVKTWLSGMKKLKSLTRWYHTLASGHGLVDFDHMDAVMALAEDYIAGRIEPEYAVYPYFHTLRVKQNGRSLVVEKIKI